MLTPTQAQLLLDEVAGHRWATVYRVALELRLRRGEILALRWGDIDFERKVPHVTGTIHRHSGKLHRDAPKTESSRRLLPMTSTLSLWQVSSQPRKAPNDIHRLGLSNGENAGDPGGIRTPDTQFRRLVL